MASRRVRISVADTAGGNVGNGAIAEFDVEDDDVDEDGEDRRSIGDFT